MHEHCYVCYEYRVLCNLLFETGQRVVLQYQSWSKLIPGRGIDSSRAFEEGTIFLNL